MQDLLSVGNNRKLKRTIGIFNLPPKVTCPGMSKVCEQVCYAKKSQIYPAARAMRERNLEATKQPDFVDRMVTEIKRRKLTRIRLQEAGDIYSEEYLQKLIAIAQALPGVKFLAYTKSFHLDFSQVPPNMIIYWSTDASNKGTEPKNGREAYLVQKGEPIPASFVTCDQAGQKSHYCGSRCAKCWIGLPRIYFNKH